MEFPCFMYHAEHGARLFADSLEYEQAGEGWVDTPAALEAPTEPVPKKRAARKTAE
jgi:hypothetical protein